MRQTRPFGRFRLMDRIASGGMAEVYRALGPDERGQPQVIALKLMLPHCNDDEDFIEMMRDEAKITRHFRHPNLARVLEFGQVDGRYYLAIEYIHGRDLRAVIKASRERQEYLPVEHALYVMACALEGIHSAHIQTDERGRPLQVIHRDISPSNIIVPYAGSVKVIDFGIAKAALSKTRTRIGVIKGKVRYMSPEQTEGKKLDARSDVFSAGIVLYELLTLRAPFAAANDNECIERIRTEDPVWPSQIDSMIPTQVDEILMKALAKRRAARYQSAHEFAAALQALLLARYAGYQPHWAGDYIRELFRQPHDQDQQLLAEYLEGGDSFNDPATGTDPLLTRTSPRNWLGRLASWIRGLFGSAPRSAEQEPLANRLPTPRDPLPADHTDHFSPPGVRDAAIAEALGQLTGSPTSRAESPASWSVGSSSACPTPRPVSRSDLPEQPEAGREELQDGSASAAEDNHALSRPPLGDQIVIGQNRSTPGGFFTHPESGPPLSDPVLLVPLDLSRTGVGDLPTIPMASIIPPDPPERPGTRGPILPVSAIPGLRINEDAFGELPTRRVDSPLPPELIERERDEAPRAISRIVWASDQVELTGSGRSADAGPSEPVCDAHPSTSRCSSDQEQLTPVEEQELALASTLVLAPLPPDPPARESDPAAELACSEPPVEATAPTPPFAMESFSKQDQEVTPSGQALPLKRRLDQILTILGNSPRHPPTHDSHEVRGPATERRPSVTQQPDAPPQVGIASPELQEGNHSGVLPRSSAQGPGEPESGSPEEDHQPTRIEPIEPLEPSGSSGN